MTGKLDWQDTDLVFSSRLGIPVYHRNLVRRSFEPLLERAGPPKIRFHDLRHTCVTILLSESVYIKTVQEMLRHSKTSTTLDFYSHALPDKQDEAIAVMAGIFGSQTIN